MISKWDWSGPTDAEFQIIVNTSNIIRFTKESTDRLSISGGATEDDTWYNVVAYHDADGNYIGIVVNGTAATPVSTATGMHDGGLAIAFGAASDGNASSAVDGIMDEIALHSKVLSTAEITDLYNEKDGTAHGKAYPYIPDS